jgi:predicted ATPase
VGWCWCSSGNRARETWYENGLQRQLFLPFIHRLKVLQTFVIQGFVLAC